LADRLKIPEILQMPQKLLPIVEKINDYRYFLIEGGRGGGKSHAVGRWILYLAERQKLRVVCGREIQKSINESVYSLLSDLVHQFNLNYEVQSQKIMHRKSESDINFRGFREQGSFNIQGMEGIDIVWIDESQALTKQTLDVLIPTIRKEKAKIFFTMNRHVPNDPAYEMFVGREDCFHIHLNYNDNPYCTQALIREANECKKKSESDYNHIWLGEPLAQSEDAVFAFDDLLKTSTNKHELKTGYGRRLAGFDIARYGDDKCACVILQQMGALHWEEIFTDEWEHRDLNYTTGRILMTANQYEVNTSIIDEDGLGSGPLDTLTKGRGLEHFVGFRNPILAYKDNKNYANPRTANTYKVKDMIDAGHLALNDTDLMKELCTLRYQFDHQQRKRLIPKEVMRNKYKIKSPNKADSLIMAASLIGEVKEQQDRQYINVPKYSKEESLFSIAGIR